MVGSGRVGSGSEGDGGRDAADGGFIPYNQGVNPSRLGAAWGRIPFVMVVVTSAVLAVATWPASYDDAYITYTFARSLAEGQGLTWNGEVSLGTTSPLLAVVLAGLQRLVPLGVPLWGHLVSWIAVAGTGCGLCALGRRDGWPRSAAAAAVVWPLLPSTVALLGGEMLVLCAVAVALTWALLTERRIVAGVLLGFAVALRFEAAVLALIVAAGLWWRGADEAEPALATSPSRTPTGREPVPPSPARSRCRRILAVALPAAGVFALWLLLLGWLTGGELVPRTLAAKQAQAASSLGQWQAGGRFVAAAARFLGDSLTLGAAPRWVTGLLALVGLGWAAGRVRPGFGWWLLVLWGGGHLLLVFALHVPFYPWYALPTVLAGLLAVTVVAETRGRFRWVAPVCVALALAAGGWPVIARTVQSGGDPRRLTYGRMADWIAERYSARVSVAAVEVGYLGYRNQFRVRDLLGLVDPAVAPERVARADVDGLIAAVDPDLVVVGATRGSLLQPALLPGKTFASTHVLEHVQLDSSPPLLLYRHGRLPGRSAIVLDWYARLAAAASRQAPAGVGLALHGSLQLPSVQLEAGARLPLGPLPAVGLDSLVFAAAAVSGLPTERSRGGVAAAGEAGPSATSRSEDRLVLLLRRGQDLHRLGERALSAGGSSPWIVPLPAAASGVLVLSCASSDPCSVALPHLRRESAGVGGSRR